MNETNPAQKVCEKRRHLCPATIIITLLLAALFPFACLSRPKAWAQSTSPTGAAEQQPPRSEERALPAAPPASLAAGVFPLNEVRRGLQAIAYTVFEGTTPEAMRVEILGILHNAIGPGKDLILARLRGTRPEYTGVVAGMSGSPVYVDGKLLGALSYRIGEFSKEPIAGITPIQQMLEVRDARSFPATPQLTAQLEAGESQTAGSPNHQPGLADGPGGSRAAILPGGSSEVLSMASPLGSSFSSGIHPIETPLVLSGFSPEAVALWQQQFSGFSLPSTGGIGSGAQTSFPRPDNAPLLPGSAISAVLVRGDLEIAATCTVTYIDPTQLLACGHPITQFGAISFPMTKAEVLATLPSPFNSFKIVNTTETVGSFTDDRISAIRGVFGEKARMIPVTVAVSGSVKPRTLHFEVINQPQITPSAVLVAVYQSLLEDNGGGADNTYHVKGAIQLEGSSPVTIDTWAAPTESLPASLIAALQMGDRFNRLYSNTTRINRIIGVQLDAEVTSRRLQLQIEGAHVSNLSVHAGDEFTVEASLRPYRGQLRNLRIPVKLPATLPSGTIRLLVSDGPTLDRISQPPRPSGRPLDINATIAQINSLHRNDNIYVTLLRPEAQATVDGRTLSSLPLSMANVFEPLRNAQELTLSGESVTPVTSVEVDAPLLGQQVIALHVE